MMRHNNPLQRRPRSVALMVAFDAVRGPADRQAVARVEIIRQQLLVSGIHIPDKSPYNSVGGKYRGRIDGADSGQSGSSFSTGKIDSLGCLPKQGTLIIK